MCAITGIVQKQPAEDPERQKRIIERMTRVQFHRGPDAEGYFCDPRVLFGHRRLSIIDLAGGAQPVCNETGTVVVILNGEIYNYRELRKELISRGHVFSSSSDTEVIVHLYEDAGADFLNCLDGMFALALYDREKNRVILARDRAGKKPLVYFVNGGTLVFSSEMAGLREHPKFPAELDAAAIDAFLSLQYIPAPGTVYRGVKKLRPGHWIEFSLADGSFSEKRYWKLDYSQKSTPDFPAAAKELRTLVEKAVEKRLVCDVPLGVFLSGGIDSAIVAAAAAELRGGDVLETFTIGFDDRAYDERSGARMQADFINSRKPGRVIPHEKTVSAGDFRLVEKLVKHYGEPYADASMVPTALLSEFARERITVALSGDGADELFGGYERYIAMRYASYFDRWMTPGMRQALFGTAARLVPDRFERSFFGRLRRMLFSCASSPELRYFAMLDRCREPVKKAIFNGPCNASQIFADRFGELTSPEETERFSELDFNCYMPNDVLTKVDIASMAASLEVRSPLLDRNVAEFAASLPWEYKLCGSCRKRILREAFRDCIAPELLNAPKRGFGVPVAQFLRTIWKEDAYGHVLEEDALYRGGLFNRDAIRQIWEAHESGRRDHSYLLWSLLILALFLHQERP